MDVSSSGSAFLQAVARMEGFYKAGSRAARNLNPGNIEFGRFAVAHGATCCESNGRFAVFGSEKEGFAAMRALFDAPGYKHLAVGQAIAKWAPPSENDTAHYVEFVCNRVGCKPSDTLDSVLGKES